MSAVKQLVSIDEKDVSRFEDTEAGSAAVAAEHGKFGTCTRGASALAG